LTPDMMSWLAPVPLELLLRGYRLFKGARVVAKVTRVAGLGACRYRVCHVVSHMVDEIWQTYNKTPISVK